MEENKKVNPEEVEAKENDCKLTDKELEKAAGGGEVHWVLVDGHYVPYENVL